MKYLITISIGLISLGSLKAQNNANTMYGQSFTQSHALTPGRLVIHMNNMTTTNNLQLFGYVRYITDKWIILSSTPNSNDYVIVLLQNYTLDQQVLNKKVMVNGSITKTAYTSEIANKINTAQLTNPYTQNGFVMNSSGLAIVE